MCANHSSSSSLTNLVDGVTTPESTSVTMTASCFCARRLPPRTYCDALVALLHDGFKQSDWCDQEVGVAFGRSIPVAPVSIDIDPYGFLGTFQAIPWPKAHAEEQVVQDIIGILLADKRTTDRVVEGMVRKVEHAGSYLQANNLSTTLAKSSAVAVSYTHLTLPTKRIV